MYSRVVAKFGASRLSPKLTFEENNRATRNSILELHVTLQNAATNRIQRHVIPELRITLQLVRSLHFPPLGRSHSKSPKRSCPLIMSAKFCPNWLRFAGVISTRLFILN